MGRRSGAISPSMGDDGGVNSRVTGAPLLGRLLLIGVVALGLVGMHHLMVAGCAQLGITAGSHGGHGQSGLAATHASPAAQGFAAQGSVLSVSVASTTLVAPLGQTPMSGGATDAAITCLAVLLLVLLLRPPGVLGALQRMFTRWRILLAEWSGRTLEPPDLIQLSISRT